MSESQYLQYVELLKLDREINLDTSFRLANYSLRLLKDEATVKEGRDLVIRVLDVWENLPAETHRLWNDVVEVADLYPYTRKELATDSTALRLEYYRSDNLENVYLHPEQADIANLLLNTGQGVILSAPTSFGKSLLIEEVVASKRYKNIVIIQPTLALLDETRKKLKKYDNHYNTIVSTRQRPVEGANLFLFTGERVVEYEHFPEIDFFVLDEFYKLSLDRKDERAIALNCAIYRLLKMTRNFYMLGPHIESVSQEFIEASGAQWVKTSFETVAVDSIDMYVPGEKSPEKEERLFQLLMSLSEPTLVYCSSPNRALKFAEQYLEYLHSQNNLSSFLTEEGGDIIEWIDENIDQNWKVGKALRHSIGVHCGALPRHLSSAVVDLFNEEKLRFLFCTSTLIEGVNTSAKNVVLFDRTRGNQVPLDYFDFRNIAGRSGRMMRHFKGKIYKFYPDPPVESVEVAVPLVEQDEAPVELLIQLDKDDQKPESKEKVLEFERFPQDLQELLRRHKGIDLNGQLAALQVLESAIEIDYSKIAWTGIPAYEQLDYIMGVIWNNLLPQGERTRGGVTTAKQLTWLTHQYSREKSVKTIIQKSFESEYLKEKIPDDEVRLQHAIIQSLQTVQHWFGYKLPKLLAVASDIQAYVCDRNYVRPGDYTYFASYIENSFLPGNLAVLLEYGIPSSAIKKIEKLIPQEVALEELRSILEKIDLNKSGLLRYEQQRIANFVGK